MPDLDLRGLFVVGGDGFVLEASQQGALSNTTLSPHHDFHCTDEGEDSARREVWRGREAQTHKGPLLLF
jgi:hypothetical protein